MEEKAGLVPFGKGERLSCVLIVEGLVFVVTG